MPIRFPGYEVVRELGRGGMGAVYLARETRLQRPVALKLIRPDAVHPDDLSRFLAEARVLARLNHPHIVSIYAVSEGDGTPFFTMEWLGGGTLAQQLNGTPFPPGRAATLAETLARAMHFVHQSRIIHRDLKPANVMLTAAGVPKIGDFGLAKRLDTEGSLNSSGAIVGTPSYMAPEQAMGNLAEAVGPRADVYALGAILYEMLTGRPPFRAATTLDTILQVLGGEPVPPTRLNSRAPRDLETICLKCLRKNPRHRYQTAEELAEDLRRFRSGEPLQARPVGSLERSLKWIRRRPAVATALAVGLFALVSLLAVWALFTARVQTERDLARRERDQADRARKAAEQANRRTRNALDQKNRALEGTRQALATAERTLTNSRIAQANAAVQEANPVLAQELLDRCPPAYRFWDWRYVRRRAGGSQFTLYGHDGSVVSVAWSPAGGLLASAGEDNTLKVWDARSGRELYSHQEFGSSLYSVAFSPDGRLLACAGSNDQVTVLEARTGKEVIALRGLKGILHGVCFSPEGRFLAGAADRVVKLWEVRNRKEVATLRTDDWATGLAFSPDGRSLAVITDNVIQVWHWQTGRLLRPLEGHAYRVLAAAFSPDGTRLASGSRDGTVRVWDAHTGRELFRLNHEDVVYGVAFSPDGQRLASACGDRTVKVWDARTPTDHPLLCLRGHADEVRSVAFSPDGQRLVSGGKDGTVRVWDARGAGPDLHFPGPKGGVTSLAFNSDGTRLVTGGPQTLKVYDTRSGRELLTLPAGLEKIDRLAFTAGGGRLLALGAAGPATLLKVWGAKTGKEIASLKLKRPVALAVLGPRGRRVAVWEFDARAHFQLVLRDAETGRRLLSLEKLTGAIRSVESLAFSPDGNYLAAGVNHSGLKVLNLRTRQQVLSLRGARDEILCVCLDSNARRLASAASDHTITLWDVSTGRELLVLRGHEAPVTGMCFSPDGERLVSAGGAGKAIVWDARNGQEIVTLAGKVSTICFSPDGERLAAVTDGRVTLRDGRVGQEVLTLSGHNPGAPFKWLAFSADSKHLAAAGTGPGETWWDLGTAKEAFSPRKRGRLAHGLAFSPDRRWLAVAQGSVVRVVDTALSSRERAVRRALAEPDLVWHRHEAAVARRSGHWFAAAVHLGQLIRARPKDASLRVERGGCYGQLGEFDRASREFSRATQWEPDGGEAWSNLALAQLAAGREDDYRRTCRRIVQRFRPQADAALAGLLFRPPAQSWQTAIMDACLLAAAAPPGIAPGHRAAYACVVRPDALSDPGQLLPLAVGRYAVVRGAVWCRAGRYEEAVKVLRASTHPLAPLYRALAEYRRGRPGEARQALHAAANWFGSPARHGSPRTNYATLSWSLRLAADLLRREVELLLQGGLEGHRRKGLPSKPRKDFSPEGSFPVSWADWKAFTEEEGPTARFGPRNWLTNARRVWARSPLWLRSGVMPGATSVNLLFGSAASGSAWGLMD